MAPAQRALKVAAEILLFFEAVILEHHTEEERELFLAVLLCAARGEEHSHVQTMVERLTVEHRQMEAWWSRLKPPLKQIAKGHATDLHTVAQQQLDSDYHTNAAFQETEFLPLSQEIPGRNQNHMMALGMALGMSLHMRHVKPAVGYI